MDRIQMLGNILNFNVCNDFTRQTSRSPQCSTTNKCSSEKHWVIKIKESPLILEYSKNNYVWIFKKSDQPTFDLSKENKTFPKTNHFSLPVLKFNRLFRQITSNIPHVDHSLHDSNESYFHQLNLNKIKNCSDLNLISSLNVQRKLASVTYPNVSYVKFWTPHVVKRSYTLDLLTFYNKCSFPRQPRSFLFNYFSPKEQNSIPYLNIFYKNKLLSEVFYKFVWRRNLAKPKLCGSNSCTENSENVSNDNAENNTVKTKPTLLSSLAKIRAKVRKLHSKMDEEITRKEFKHKMFLEECKHICESIATPQTDRENLSDLNFEDETNIDDEELERKSCCLNKVFSETSNSENVNTENEKVEVELELNLQLQNVATNDDFQINRQDQHKDYFKGLKTGVREIPGLFVSSLSYLVNMSASIIVRLVGRNALTMCCF